MKNSDVYQQMTLDIARYPDQEWNPIVLNTYNPDGFEVPYTATTEQSGDWTCFNVKQILQNAVYMEHNWLNFGMREQGISVDSYSFIDFWSPYIKVGDSAFKYVPEHPYLSVRIFLR